MNREEMIVLYEYNAWADRRALEASSALSTEQFTKQLCSSFSSVRDTLSHIYGAEWVWLERFQGRSPAAFPDDSEFIDLAKLKTSWAAVEQKLLNFVHGLTQEDLDRVMEYKTFKFGVYSNPLWQSMQHLVNHGTYHRGQLRRCCGNLGRNRFLQT